MDTTRTVKAYARYHALLYLQKELGNEYKVVPKSLFSVDIKLGKHTWEVRFNNQVVSLASPHRYMQFSGRDDDALSAIALLIKEGWW
jgi:hypothetical protein